MENEKTGGFLGSVSRFIGAEDLGRGIAGTIMPYTKEGRELETMLDSGKISPDDYLKIRYGDLTPRDVVASGLQTGLSAVAFSGGLPAGVKGTTAFGAASGAIEAGKKEEGVLPGAVKGAVIGATIGLISSGIGKAIKAIPKYQETFARKVFRQGSAELTAESSGMKPILSKQLVSAIETGKTGLKGSDEQLLRTSAEKISSIERQVQDIVTRNSKTSINTVNLIRSLDTLVERKRNVYGQAGISMINDFKRTLLEKGGKISLPAANKLKRDIYKELGEASFNREVLPQNKEVLRSVASAIREEMVNTLTPLKKLNAEQQFYIRAADNIERVLNNKQKLNMIGLSDTILATGGILSGDPLTGVGSAFIKRALEGTQFRTRAISGLGKIKGVTSAVKSVLPEGATDFAEKFVTRRMTRD